MDLRRDGQLGPVPAGPGRRGDFSQRRTHDAANEITGFGAFQGDAGWARPASDRNGNMLSVPCPLSPTTSFTCTYDAWNRLVQIFDAATEQTVVEYAYDGRGYRITTQLPPPSASGGGAAALLLQQPMASAGGARWRVRRPPIVSMFGAGATSTTSYSATTAPSGCSSSRTRTGRDGRVRLDRPGRRAYQYTAYGQPAFLTGGFAGLGESSYDVETLYCGYRWESGPGGSSSATASWPNLALGPQEPDGAPVGAGVYAYAGDPLAFTDPIGLAAAANATPPKSPEECCTDWKKAQGSLSVTSKTKKRTCQVTLDCEKDCHGFPAETGLRC